MNNYELNSKRNIEIEKGPNVGKFFSTPRKILLFLFPQIPNNKAHTLSL